MEVSMSLPKQYDPEHTETRLQAAWQESGIYHFEEKAEQESPAERESPAEQESPAEKPAYSIDTPPPTVSGNLHLGHVYSYSQVDFFARFRRMQGFNVFYPMGYDDNGLPTERLVEKRLGITAFQVGRAEFIEKCLQVSEEAEQDYRELWQRLGLSVDWRHTYRTIDERSRRISQRSFIDLYHKGLAYRRQAPAIWCPECRTALAQADLNDLQRESEFVTLRFDIAAGPAHPGDETYIPIATTRPELLPACVAVFVHPDDPRYRSAAGQKLVVPLFGQQVPVLTDPGADPEIGSGAVMCCTFGDSADVAWWFKHRLPLIEAIDKEGRMTQSAGQLAGLGVEAARQAVKQALHEAGFILSRQATTQSVRVHERCDTTVEYVVVYQWFIRLLDFKEDLIQAGENVVWHPDHMRARYRLWVENLNWDWCISRQRYYGVPFPVWYCRKCGEILLADDDQLPVDPTEHEPGRPCTCGSLEFIPESDVQDTWATSSLTPQIVGRWPGGDPPGAEPQGDLAAGLYERVFPFSLRPQAHEIIRTWAFYTIVKSQFNFGQIPWREVLISGWGLAGEGMGKISKSRTGGPMPPLEMIERYSADALRYWAASTGTGKDALISEEKIQMGARLAIKLWNVARFSERFLQDYLPQTEFPVERFTPADRWTLASLQRLIRRVTELMEAYEYSAAKSEIETFFWSELADNYLEMSKVRLYDGSHPGREGARFTLYHSLLCTLKLFAPFLPYITEEIYLSLFATPEEEPATIHTSTWPVADPRFDNPTWLEFGSILVTIATAVRRYKSEHNLPLGFALGRLQLALANGAVERITLDPAIIKDWLAAAIPDLISVTRAERIEITDQLEPGLVTILDEAPIRLGIDPSQGKIV
jgi:valyl-tRNA synthetase